MTNIDATKYLLEEDDGLLMRDGQTYALYKLKALEEYLIRATTSMKSKPWRERYFIDLQAGPGKNSIDNAVRFGSPLIALTAKSPFTQYRMNEWGDDEFKALKQRVSSSPIYDRVKLYQEDLNVAVHKICDEIDERDKPYLKDIWPCFNVAFLDPEGLELEWTTVARLAKVKRMDLIINFSTGGINRLLGVNTPDVIDRINRFFGTDEWQALPSLKTNNATQKRREWIDFYLGRLREFKYYTDEDPEWGGMEMAIKNSKNVQVYSMIFACKHPLGDTFWKQSVKKAQGPKLPGFE